MKSIFTTTLLLFFITVTYAQKPSKLDSLKKVLANLPADGKSFASDTLRVRVLCEMVEEGLFLIGDASVSILEEAQRIADKRKWLGGIAMVQNTWGVYHAAKNEYMLAIDFFYKSLLSSTELDNKLLIAKNYVGLSDCYSLLGNHKKAIDFNIESLKIYKNLKKFESYLRGINSLGMLYHDNKNYHKAITIFKKGLFLNKSYHYPKLDIFFLSNLGLSLTRMQRYDEAIKCYNQILENNREYHKNIDIVIFISLAEIFSFQNQPRKALSYLKQAKNLIKTGQGGDDAMLFFSEVSYKVYKQLNQPEEALNNYIIYNEIKQRHSKQDVEKRIQSLQFEFDNKNQQKEIQTLRRNGFITLGIVTILAIFGLILFRINKKLTSKNNTIEKQKEEITEVNRRLEVFNNELEEQVELRTVELKKVNADLLRKNDEIMAALVEGQKIERRRVSVELHDNLGSTITAIKWRLSALELRNLTSSEFKIYQDVIQMVENAYSEVRFISHNMLPAEFEKKGLKKALEKLVSDINMNDKFKLSLIYKQPDQFLENTVAIELYSICLELVNNMIKHSNGSEGEIYLLVTAKAVILNVKDNGKFSHGLKEGFGLKNIKARILKLDGEIDILLTDLGTDIIVKIPIKQTSRINSDNMHTA
jgi:signal transduction histidine kinase